MALTEAQCLRRDDAGTTKDIKTYLDSDTGDHIQAIAFDDDSGNQLGILANPLHIQSATLLLALQNLLTELRLKADLTETQPISAAALPLPSGAATSILQLPDGHDVDVTDRAARDVGKVDIADIDGFASIAGQKTKAASLPVTLASDEDPLAVTGTFWQVTQPISAAALPLPSGAATSILQLPDGHGVDVIDRAARDLGKVDIAGIDAIGTVAGQAAMAASLPVVVASDQGTIPVKGQVGLVIDEYDYIDLGYTGGDLTSAVYKAGGAGGATVATLTLAYDGSGNLDTITKT